MRITWSKAGGAERSNTGSGQTSPHLPHRVHSPREKSIDGLPPANVIMPVGQAVTHAPHDVQAAKPSRDTPGGQTHGACGPSRPRRILRRVSWVSLIAPSMRWRTRRSKDDLIHPDK